MLTKEELLKCAVDVINLQVIMSSHSFDDVSIDNEVEECTNINRIVLDDWYEKFGGNKTLALVTWGHACNTYYEQGGDEERSLEKYIWNKNNRRDEKNFMYELQARILATLSWVTL